MVLGICVLGVVVHDLIDSTAYVRFHRKLSTKEKHGENMVLSVCVGLFSNDVDIFSLHRRFFWHPIRLLDWEKHGPIYVRRNFPFAM